MFTKQQYKEAIDRLKEASTQLQPDGQNCVCCGDSGHQAWECGFNPLLAMQLCEAVAKSAQEMSDKIVADNYENLHDLLDWLSGRCTRMGEPVGPAKIRMPKE